MLQLTLTFFPVIVCQTYGNTVTIYYNLLSILANHSLADDHRKAPEDVLFYSTLKDSCNSSHVVVCTIFTVVVDFAV